MKKITIEAGHLPELTVQPTYYDRIIETLKEEKNGLTNHEICVKKSQIHFTCKFFT